MTIFRQRPSLSRRPPGELEEGSEAELSKTSTAELAAALDARRNKQLGDQQLRELRASQAAKAASRQHGETDGLVAAKVVTTEAEQAPEPMMTMQQPPPLLPAPPRQPQDETSGLVETSVVAEAGQQREPLVFASRSGQQQPNPQPVVKDKGSGRRGHLRPGVIGGAIFAVLGVIAVVVVMLLEES